MIAGKYRSSDYRVQLGQRADGSLDEIPSVSHARFRRATGAAAIALNLAPKVAWQLEEIRVHLSAAGGAGNLTATIDNGAGSAYDFVILTQDMTAVTDLIWHAERPMEFERDTELNIAWANAGTKTYGIEIVYKAI